MAETLINKTQTASGIWTSDSLVAGDNISITEVDQPVIDANTLGVWHFENNDTNAVNGSELGISKTGFTKLYSNSNSKFNNYCVQLRLLNTTQGAIDLFQNYGEVFSSDFTLDFWVRSLGSTGTGSTSFSIAVNRTTPIVSFFIYKNKIECQNSLYSKSVSENTWHHLAFERYSNIIYCYIDGEMVYSTGEGQPLDATMAYTRLISGTAAANCPYIDEMRLSNIARYEGQNFTPFTKPYASITQYQINNTAETLPSGISYVPAVLPNFEKYDVNSSEPAVSDYPLVNDLQQAYSFNDHTNIRIPNILADVSNLSSFDIVTACKTTSSAGSPSDGIISILVNADANADTLRITKDTSGYIRFRVYFNITDKDIDITSSSPVLPVGQKTWLKVSYSSTTGYELSYSTDGTTWSSVITSSLTTPLNNTCNNIFFGRNGTSYYQGTMYMRDTYININGQRVFNAVNIGKVPMIMD